MFQDLLKTTWFRRSCVAVVGLLLILVGKLWGLDLHGWMQAVGDGLALMALITGVYFTRGTPVVDNDPNENDLT